ncbi:MAG: amidohydrolase family protein [Chitinophagaceae bacterium]|nr:amidohydrolase family protein [Chitinophagaceae bacterium]
MRKLLILFCISCLIVVQLSAQSSHTISFEVSDVTQPSISLMPNGKSFVFNILGHLFRMPSDGGVAKQLTFGPYYDSEPSVSPDGSKIAFISNRDGSDGNLYVMDVNGSNISRLSNVFMVGGKPAWSPDSKQIAFLSLWSREEYALDKVPFFGNGDMALLYTVNLDGSGLKRITDARAFGAVFYLPDGSLAWSVTETKGGGSQMPGIFGGPANVTTIIKIRTPNSSTNTRAGSFSGRTGRIVMLPGQKSFYFVSGGNLKQYNIGDTASVTVAPFQGGATDIGLSSDGKMLVAAADSKLWTMDITGGVRKKIEWQATVKMEVVKPASRKWSPISNEQLATPEILTPELSPDGSRLVFMAAGSVWLQDISGGPARKVLNESAYQIEPSFSPDGRLLAIVSDFQGRRQLRVLNLLTGKTTAITTVDGSSWPHQPSWSNDGKYIIYQQTGLLGAPYRFIKAGITHSNDTATVTLGGHSWNGRPHFSGDGQHIYFTARQSMIANIYRIATEPGSAPVAVTNLRRHAHDGLVAPDGKWIALRRNAEIWLAAYKGVVLTDNDFHLFSKVGGRSFSFTADGSAIVYSDGTKVWKKPLNRSKAIEIPVHLDLRKAIPTPTLITNVHVLDFKTGQFTNATSVYLEDGKISWIGSPSGKKLAANTERINGGGRYAIPGIMDSHIHSAWHNQQITEDRLLAYGVTSIRDVGSRLDLINSLKERGAVTNLPIPRYFASGEIFEGMVPLWGDAFMEINTIQEARDYVKYAKAHGADFIKVYASLPWYLKSEVAAEAARQNMPIVGHGIALDEITRSINFGIQSIEHSGPNGNDIVQMMKNAGTYLDPTPTIFSTGNTAKLADSSTLDKKFITFIPEPEIKAAGFGRKPSEGQLSGWKNTLAALKRIFDSGIPLLDGTDALMTGVFHGPSVHWVLQFYSESGIPNIEVLKLATLTAAKSVGADEFLGSLEPGKIADILLLDKNPLHDISNTMKIWRVIKGGNTFDPAVMRK